MIKIDKTNMPVSLKLNFNEWITKFDIYNSPLVQEFINKINTNKDIKITFSEESAYKEFGVINLEELKNKVLNSYDFNDETRLLINNIYTLRELRSKIKLIIARKIKERNLAYYELIAKVENLLELSKYNVYLTSTYDNNSSTIIFYTKNISSIISDHTTTEQLYELAFIKELHRLFYDYISHENSSSNFVDAYNRKDHNSNLIKESLTAFYLKQYCTKNNLSASDLLSAARTLNPIIYPGAGYLSIKDKKHYDEIFNKSIYSTDEALKIMFTNDEKLYYQIVNRESTIQSLKKDLYIIPFDFMYAFEEYLVKKQRSFYIITHYKRTIKALFKQHLNIDVNILSVVDYNSRLYLVNLLLSKVEQGKIQFKHVAATKAFKKFLLSTKEHSQGINII